MSFTQEHINEFKNLFPEAKKCEEGGCIFFYIPKFELPEGCVPKETDILLCPVNRDGYESRLYFSDRIDTTKQLNWNINGVRILERNWHAFSWRTPSGLRLSQMIGVHIRGLIN